MSSSLHTVSAEAGPGMNRSINKPVAKRRSLAILQLAPGALLLAVFFLVPMVNILRLSLLQYDRIALYLPIFTLENYGKFFSDPYFLSLITNSLKIGFWTTLIALVIAYPVAFYLTRCTGWERTLISAASLLPIFVTLLVGTLGWYIIMLPYGAGQALLQSLGLIDGPLRWLRSFWGLVAVMVHLHISYPILIFASSLQEISEEKLNAARILGASTAQMFRTVVIPLTWPAITSSAILVFSLSISSYLIPVLISGQRIRVLPMAIFTYTGELLNWPFAATLAVVLLVIVSLFTYAFTALTNRLSGRGKWEVV